jgi:very-short-patch-repair endonuclease
VRKDQESTKLLVTNNDYLQTPSESLNPPLIRGALPRSGTGDQSLVKNAANAKAKYNTKEAVKKRGLLWSGRHMPYNSCVTKKARELRKNMTKQECRLWYSFLRKLPVRFYRQRPVDHFIIDFYCPEYKVGIEVDGKQHLYENNRRYDENRTKILSAYGIKMVRFTNKEIDEQFRNVCKIICEVVGIDPPASRPPF